MSRPYLGDDVVLEMIHGRLLPLKFIHVPTRALPAAHLSRLNCMW